MNRPYLDIRSHQLALLLIGIAIGRTADRKRLFESLRVGAIRDQGDREALEAIRDGDQETLYGYLAKRHRVHCDNMCALDAIIRRLHEIQERDYLEETLSTVLAGEFGECLGDAEAKLASALAAVQKAKADTFAKNEEQKPSTSE